MIRITRTLRVALFSLPALFSFLAVPAEARQASPSPQQHEFWNRLQQLCGQAFEGRAIEAPASDTLFAGRRLVMHAVACTPDEIRIALHADADRSRTWIITRSDTGLRLEHDHRHADGSPDTNTGYGGFTRAAGTAWRQEFPADAHSIALVPARDTNVWTLEIRPGVAFVYGLRREATGLRYRMEFDLAHPVPAPPPAWGHGPAGAALPQGSPPAASRPTQGGRGTPDARVTELAPLTVIGGTPAQARTVPGATRIIDADALAAQRPDAAHAALRRTTGVHVMEEDPFGLNLNIGVRGLNPRRSSRVLLLEDGVPIHLSPYNDPSAHYQPPVETLHRIEVLKGSGQVLYGPQTVGGVVNFLRMPPPARTGGAVTLRGGDGGRFAGHLDGGAVLGPAAASLSYNRRQADGARAGWHHDVSDASAQALLGTGFGTLLLRGTVYNERSRYGETGLRQAEFEQDPFGNPTPNDVFTLRRHAGHLAWEWQATERAALTALLYGQDVHRVSWRQANDARDRFGEPRHAGRFGCVPGAASLADCAFQGRPRGYRFFGAEPRLRLRLGVAGNGATSSPSAILDVGGRVHRETSERRQYLSPTAATAGGTRVRDNALDTDALAAYAQARVASGRWALTPGARLEHVRSRNENRLQQVANEDRYVRLLPGLAIAFTGPGDVVLFAGTHRGFAPPRPAEILTPEPGQGLEQVEPEVSWNHEVGVRASLPIDRRRTRDVATQRAALAIEATLFRTRFENQIIDGTLAGSGRRFVNAGETIQQGLEVMAELGGLEAGGMRPSVSLGWTWLPTAEFASGEVSAIDGATPVRGRRIPYAPAHMLDASIGMEAGFGLAATLRASHIGEQFSDDLNTREPSASGMQGVLPAYTVLGATVRQALPRAGATFFATAENLRNTVYITERIHGIMVGMPRRFTAGVEWAF
jgi:Fe(3+) dicitrate transport protein